MTGPTAHHDRPHAIEVVADGLMPGRFTAVVCGPAPDDAWAVTTASLLNGSNAARLSGIIEIDRVRPGRSVTTPDLGWERATGGHLLFVPAGGVVVADALERLGAEIELEPEADLIYVDDVALDADRSGFLTDPAHRPGFSPDRLRAQMYLGPMVVVRRTLAIEVDPDGRRLRSPLAHDLAIVAANRARAIVHVPEILFHRRDDPASAPTAEQASAAAADLNRVMADEGFPAIAVPRVPVDPEAGGGPEAVGGPMVRLEPRLDEEPPVSIIIPTNGGRRAIGGVDTVLVHHAVASLLERTTYRNYELVAVISPGGPSDLIGRLRTMVRDHRNRPGAADENAGPSIRFCHDQRPFNFSNASNRGAVHGDGEVLVFLNDDTRILSPDWLHRLVMYATRPDVGAVGTRLLYEDGSVQHAGIWTRGGHPAHRYDGFPGDHDGYRSALRIPQNCLAVTGACLAVETTKFAEVGGFSPLFPGSYNDVDLCLKLADRGYRTVVDPDAELIHYGSSSRNPGIEDWELALLHDRWRSVLNDDPFDNPHLVAPLSDEYPPPDAVVSDQRRRMGMTGHRARRWPLPTMTRGFDPTGDPGRDEPATDGTEPAGGTGPASGDTGPTAGGTDVEADRVIELDPSIELADPEITVEPSNPPAPRPVRIAADRASERGGTADETSPGPGPILVEVKTPEPGEPSTERLD